MTDPEPATAEKAMHDGAHAHTGRRKEGPEGHDHKDGEKCLECAVPVQFGVTSFAALDELRDATDTRRAIDEVIYDFQAIVDSVMRSHEMTADQKATALAVATAEMSTRVQNPPERKEKSLLERTRDLFLGRKDDSKDKDTSDEDDTPDPSPGAFKVFDSEEGPRWLAIYSNNLYDRDGEVIPAAEHKAYIERADKDGDYPELWLWHTPGTRIGQADLLDLTSEGFAIASGTFDKEMEDVAERLKDQKGLGVSHGFSYTEKTEDGSILGYRTFEVSPLPIERAANSFTGFLVGDKETENANMAMTPEKKAFLIDKLGTARTENLEATIGNSKSTADSRGVGFKEDDSVNGGDSTEDTPGASPSDDIAQAVVDGFAEVGKRMDAQDAAIKALLEEADEKAVAAEESEASKVKSFADRIAQAMTPRGQGVYVASAAADNVAHGNTKDAQAIRLVPDNPGAMGPQMDLLQRVIGNAQPLAQVVDNDGGNS